MKRVLLVVLALGFGAFVLLKILPVVLFVLLHTDEVKVPHLFVSKEPEVIGRLELSDSAGVIIWAVENPTRVPIKLLDYGVTPVGWQQRVPLNSRPRRLLRRERLLLTLNFPPNGWARIATRPEVGRQFLHGLTASGSGCDKPECAEVFALQRRAPAN